MGVAVSMNTGLGAFRVVEQIEQAVVARRFDFPVGVTQTAWVAEVVSLVDDDHVGEFRNAPETFRGGRPCVRDRCG